MQSGAGRVGQRHDARVQRVMQRGAGRVGQRHDARVQRVGLTVDPNSAASGSGKMNKRAVTAGRSEAAARVGMRADGESRRQRRSSAARSRLGGVDFHACCSTCRAKLTQEKLELMRHFTHTSSSAGRLRESRL